ncbi:MAG TPA: cysteine synthase family protein [Planctomycetota bacterium]|nr:cysteine synthase family protein [Planctomycetota bacterium]
MVRIAADLTWLVGHTPLLELARLSPPGARIVGKLDAWNPSGSNKDRAALGMIRHAERSGFLREGGTIIECSSGDLGLAIAMIGRRLGYRVVLTMPEPAPEGRRALLLALGAEVELTPVAEGMRGAMLRAEQLARQTRGAVCLQAFTNRANARTHAETTAREIWEDTDGQVDMVVVPIGTGGTAAGCVAFFREHGVPVVGVQPAASPVLTGGAAGRHDIPGIGAGFVPEILNASELTEIVAVSDEKAYAGTRLLAQQEALLLGPASGAVIHAAVVVGGRAENNGKLVVAVLPDLAERYLDHRSMRPNP